MDEQIISRIQKIEKELRNVKILIIFLLVMFIMLAYQFLTDRQNNDLHVDEIRSKSLVIENQSGNRSYDKDL